MMRWAMVVGAGLVLGLAVQSAPAAMVPLYKPATQSGTFTEGQGLARITYFKAVTSSTIDEVGVLFDPNVASVSVRWRVFQSDGAKNVGATLFDSGTVIHADAGMQQYDTAALATLVANQFYLLRMDIVAGGGTAVDYARFLKTDQGLPFITTDGNLEVRDGAFDTGNGTNFNTTFLPPFSVSLIIPEPASLALVGVSLLSLLARPRRN